MMFFQSIPSHAYLITMLDAYVEEPHLLLVFEYLYNSLSDVFHRAHGLLPVDVSRHYAHQTLMGLRHLHAHNVAHRDLSLGNILVDTPNNSVKIADLGLAVCASHFVLERQISTLWYRAPEVFLGVEKLDFPQTAFDMWSFAGIMSALLSGTHLFRIRVEGSKSTGADVDIKVLQKQIDVLGSPVPSWPGITQLPRWSEYASKLELEASGVSADLPVKLGLAGVVKRAVNSSDCDLLAGLFRWLPSSRLTADEAALHSAWHSLGFLTRSSPSGASVSAAAVSSQALPSQEELAQRSCPKDEARENQTQEMILPKTPPDHDAKSETKQPQSNQEGAGVSAGPSQLMPPVLTNHCACRSNCGNAACERAKKKKHQSKGARFGGELLGALLDAAVGRPPVLLLVQMRERRL